MYFYKIGSYSPDGGENIEFLHRREFNEREFEDMFVESTLELLLNKREECPYLIGTEEGEIPYFMKDRKYSEKHYSNFMSILDEVGNVMIERYGFEKIQYKQKMFLDNMVPITNSENINFANTEEKSIFTRISKEFWKRKKNER